MSNEFIRRELERQRREREKVEANREQQMKMKLEGLGLEITNIKYNDTPYRKWMTADVANHDEYQAVEVQLVEQTITNARWQDGYLRTKAVLKNGKTINIKGAK